ncbi:MAG: hypothetical protein HGGPFJEG_02632 [Ignavibacteria bacterium]|nr:hypothetical protein [Ignavibacteria bacterium]
MKTLLKIFLLAGILISISKNANAQKPITWQRTYGDGNIDYGYSIVQTPDEGYIAVGRKRINTSNFIYAMRINKFGDTIWSKTYNGAVAYDIQMLDYNNYVICGSSFIKIDINGNIIWNHSLNWPYPKKFLISKENGFYLITSIDSIFSAYPLIQKMDSKGNLLWSRIYKEGIADGWFTDIK